MKRNIVHITWYSYDKNMFVLNEVNQDKQLCGGSLTNISYAACICYTIIKRDCYGGIIYIERIHFETMIVLEIYE
jgi:hypothetical protein